jgi:hypothetical protein
VAGPVFKSGPTDRLLGVSSLFSVGTFRGCASNQATAASTIPPTPIRRCVVRDDSIIKQTIDDHLKIMNAREYVLDISMDGRIYCSGQL